MVHRGDQQLRSCAHGEAMLCRWGCKLDFNGVALGSKRVQGRKFLDENRPFFPLFIRWSPAKYYYVLEVGVSPGQLYRFSPIFYRGLATIFYRGLANIE